MRRAPRPLQYGQSWRTISADVSRVDPNAENAAACELRRFFTADPANTCGGFFAAFAKNKDLWPALYAARFELHVNPGQPSAAACLKASRIFFTASGGSGPFLAASMFARALSGLVVPIM